MLDTLLQRRILFVAGKGGTGKSTVTAALALLAAQRGRRVLCVEVDAKGDLCRSLGAEPVGFEAQVVQPNISALAMHPEESLQEYLRIYFKVPRFTRMTPLSHVFDFVATGVPGTKDMLIVGKIAYEARREQRGAPVWDHILVDCSATGHVLPQLGAARAMRELARGGIIRSQVEWIDAMISDPKRTLLCVCALPEEMPVVEALELHERVRTTRTVTMGACFLNRVLPCSVGSRHVALAEALASPAHRAAAEERLGGDPEALAVGVRLARGIRDRGEVFARRLRKELTVPVVEIPLTVGARPGLATARAVAGAIEAPA